VTAKNAMNIKLFEHYAKHLFRKFKLNRFTNRQKSENKLLENFRNKYGGPDEAIFVIGDHDNGGHHMRGLEPVMCKRFRRLFLRAGYLTFLINEFRTSVLCNDCHGWLETFMDRESKKPKDKGKIVREHGLLRHSNGANCKLIHNRDKNAVQNMLDIVETIKRTGKRPEIFTRSIINEIMHVAAKRHDVAKWRIFE